MSAGQIGSGAAGPGAPLPDSYARREPNPPRLRDALLLSNGSILTDLLVAGRGGYVLTAVHI
jgi:hypothetical protein